MTPNHEQHADRDQQRESSPPSANRRTMVFKLLAVPLVVLSAVLGLGFAKMMNCYAPPDQTPAKKTSLELPDRFCKGWQKPDLVLLLTGQQHGYLDPCGCSRPQKGGLIRRYNLIEVLKDRGWDVVAVDLGDVPQMKAPAGLQNVQGLRKYVTAMKAMQAMGHTAVGIGEYEAAMPLHVPLENYALNDPSPRVLASNLVNRNDEYPEMVGSWVPAKTNAKSPKVGVTAVVGPSVEDAIKKKDPMPKFGSATKALDSVLAEMNKGGIELRVLLYQGSATKVNDDFPKLPPEAIACAKAYPQFQVVLCADESDEPPIKPMMIDQGEGKAKTMLIRVGHKAKYVGLVGVFRTGNPKQPFEFKYESIDVGEEFLTPKDEEKKHPVLKIMEAYQKGLKDDNVLASYLPVDHPFQVNVGKSDPMPHYVGSEACKKCHSYAWDVWKKVTPEGKSHSRAYKSLVEATNPSNRQFDGECIVCHTIGFGYKTGFQTFEKTPKLINVGCESCHGPSSEHIKDNHAKKWLALMNPWKTQPNETEKQKNARILLTDAMCQRCHDQDNDVTWTGNGFGRKWPIIDHSGNADSPE
jgi:hypothetical protein